MNKSQFFLLPCFLVSCIAFAMEKQQIDRISSLKEFCIKEVLRRHLDYSSLPDIVENEVLECEKQLNHQLNMNVYSSLSHPNEVQKLLAAGADPDGRPEHGTLLEHITKNSDLKLSVINPLYSSADGKLCSRAELIVRHLIAAGARFTPRCLFNAVKTSNRVVFNLLQEKYFPENEAKWRQNSPGVYSFYEAKTDDNAWKGLRDECDRTLFHYAAVYSRDPNFLRWLFSTHAKWKYLLANDDSGDNVLDLLRRHPHDATRMEILSRLVHCMQNDYLFPVLWTERLEENIISTLGWVRNTEVVDRCAI